MCIIVDAFAPVEKAALDVSLFALSKEIIFRSRIEMRDEQNKEFLGHQTHRGVRVCWKNILQ